MFKKIILVLALVTLATPAFAQRWQPHWGGGGYHGGGGIGGNIIGGVIGGVIGGWIARPPQPYYPPQPQPQPYYQPPPQPIDPVQYCINRFRSYNPETGVYLGYDGVYRRCP